MKFPGTLSLRRFRVEGSTPEPSKAVGLIAKRAFPDEFEARGGKGEVHGWTAFDNLLDTEPDLARWVEAGRLFLALRVDRWKPPAALFRARVALEERARLAESGKAVLPAKVRKEIATLVEKEFEGKVSPSHAHYRAVWHFARKEVLLLATAEAAATSFREEFQTTFGLKLVTLRPIARTRFLDLPASATAQIDSIRPSSFAGGAPGEPPTDAFERERLLSREFLTWLWFRIEEDGGTFDVADAGSFGVMVDDGLVLEGDQSDSTRSTFRRGVPARAIEARAGVATGKKVASLKLLAARDEGEWRGTLVSPTLDVLGLSLPRSNSKHPMDLLEERLSSLDEWNRFVDGLYREFLLVRLSGGWPEASRNMERWIEEIRGELGELKPVAV